MRGIFQFFISPRELVGKSIFFSSQYVTICKLPESLSQLRKKKLNCIHKSDEWDWKVVLFLECVSSVIYSLWSVVTLMTCFHTKLVSHKYLQEIVCDKTWLLILFCKGPSYLFLQKIARNFFFFFVFKDTKESTSLLALVNPYTWQHFLYILLSGNIFSTDKFLTLSVRLVRNCFLKDFDNNLKISKSSEQF